MFTNWQQVESWIRDNGLNSWRFSYDRTGSQTDSDGNITNAFSNTTPSSGHVIEGHVTYITSE